MDKNPMKNVKVQSQGVQGYSVQFTMPVDNPEDNVRKRRGKGYVSFECPINLQDIHKLTLADLLVLAANTENRDVSTTFNNTD